MTMTTDLAKTGFIGAGNMAGSLIGGMLKSGVAPERIIAADPRPGRACREAGIALERDNRAVAATADTLVLAVKPQVMQAVCEEIAPAVRQAAPLIISIAAGVRIASIHRWLGGGPLAIIRVMPNTPALVGQGMSALFANARCDAGQKQRAETMLRAVGDALWLADEAEMDAVTALSGSGPAYFFMFMECLIEAGAACGLRPELARRLVLQTALGAAAMASTSKASPQTLRRQVTSPGGTTARALGVLTAGGLQQLVTQATRSAASRAAQLSGQGETAQ